MKTKAIDRAIGTFENKINKFKKKGINEHATKTTAAFQALEDDLNKSLGLQKEVHTLRDALKSKKKELETEVVNLKRDSKKLKKAQKKDK